MVEKNTCLHHNNNENLFQFFHVRVVYIYSPYKKRKPQCDTVLLGRRRASPRVACMIYIIYCHLNGRVEESLLLLLLTKMCHPAPVFTPLYFIPMNKCHGSKSVYIIEICCLNKKYQSSCGVCILKSVSVYNTRGFFSFFHSCFFIASRLGKLET